MDETVSTNLNTYFDCGKSTTTHKTHSIELFKEREIQEKITIHEKNLLFLSKLPKLKTNIKHNEELFQSFKSKTNTIYVNPKTRLAYNVINKHLNYVRTVQAIQVLKSAIAEDLNNYKDILQKQLLNYNMRHRYCDKCDASYPTFLKTSRHCFNCKVETSVNTQFDNELKKEFDRFYFNIHERNRLQQRIELISNIIKTNCPQINEN